MKRSFSIIPPQGPLGTGELRATDDGASSAAGSDHGGTGGFGSGIVRPDRVGADGPARALSHAFSGDGYVSRGRVLLTGAPHSRLRRDRVRRIAVVAGCGERHLTVEIILCVGCCGAQRDGLKLTLTLTGAAGQCKGRRQKQSEKRKREPKPFHNPS